MALIKKQLLAKEDMLLSADNTPVSQARAGTTVSVHPVNASVIPYDENRSIAEAIQGVTYTHPLTHPVSIIDGSSNPSKFVKTDALGNTGFDGVAWADINGKPGTYTPSAHEHSLDEVTSGSLVASRIIVSENRQFITAEQATQLLDMEVKSNKGIPNGYAPLNSNGKIDSRFLSDSNLVEVFTPADLASMLALTSAQPGDIAYRQDNSTSYMLVALPSSTEANWKSLNTGSQIISVNGQTGIVSLDTSDIAEATNLYFTNERVDDRVAALLQAGTNITLTYNDALNTLTISANDTSVNWSEIQSKPTTLSGYGITDAINVSQKGVANGVATLDASGLVPVGQLPSYVDDVLEYTNLGMFPAVGEPGKIYVALDTNKTYRWSGTVYIYITSGAVDSVAGKTGVVSLVKADVGLSNVDNTSDLLKPISTATAAELALKAPLASPALTGTPTAPTAAVGTSTTQLATTAFVKAEIANDSTAVHKTGDETIAGVKTFSSSIVGNITGNANNATTATNQSGGSVNATTGRFAKDIITSQSITIGTGGNYSAGSIFSDPNWGMLFRAKQPSPTLAQFVWMNSEGSELFRFNGTALTTNITGNAATATHLSATQQSNAILGANKPTSIVVNDSTNNGSFVCRAAGTGDGNLAGMTFWNDTYAIKLGVRNDGAFGLGGGSRHTWSWYSDSAGNMVATGNVTAYSDPRLKENFVNIENPIELVKKLNGGTFNWKHGFTHTEVKAGKKDYGILANEVEAIMPEIVTDSIGIEGEKYKTVCYEKIVPLLIEAIKEQQKQIDELKALAKGA